MITLGGNIENLGLNVNPRNIEVITKAVINLQKKMKDRDCFVCPEGAFNIQRRVTTPPIYIAQRCKFGKEGDECKVSRRKCPLHLTNNPKNKISSIPG